MLNTENITIDGNDFVHTWSDLGMYILQTDTQIEYEEAYDLVAYPHTYEETDHPIEEEEPTIEEKAEAYDILMGGTEE